VGAVATNAGSGESPPKHRTLFERAPPSRTAAEPRPSGCGANHSTGTRRSFTQAAAPARRGCGHSMRTDFSAPPAPARALAFGVSATYAPTLASASTAAAAHPSRAIATTARSTARPRRAASMLLRALPQDVERRRTLALCAVVRIGSASTAL
jgi:hypothetical protein